MLKHVLTIKNPVHLQKIKTILTHDPECKPIDRMLHAFSENRVKNETCLYVRDKYRYKKHKEEKRAMDSILL